MKLKYMLLACMPLWMASCSEEDVVSGKPQQQVRVTAGLDNNSRMVLSDQGSYFSCLWENSDQISLFTSNQSNLVYRTTIEENTATAAFTPLDEALEDREGNVVYACYPDVTLASEEGLVVNLPATDTIDYDNGTLRSFAYAASTISDGNVNFKFKHISAFLGLTVTPDMLSDATKGIRRVNIGTSSAEPLCIGKGDTFDFTTETLVTTNSGNSLTVNVDNVVVDSEWTIYIPILPQPSDANITITLEDSEGTALYTLTKQAPESGFVAGYAYHQDATGNFEVAYLQTDANDRQNAILQLGTTPKAIQKIEFITEIQVLSEKYVDISADDSPVPVYASFNSTDSLLTILTQAKIIEIADASYLFADYSNLQTINWGKFKISEKTTSMCGMFEGCQSLTSLDVSNWNVASVQDMRYMFDGCSALTTLNVSQWNTASLNNPGAMFRDCSGLATIDVSNWNMDNVHNIGEIFSGCSALTNVDVSHWNTANVSDMNKVFNGCSSLTALDLSNWSISNVGNMDDIFANCVNLTQLNISNWSFNEENTYWYSYMFDNCASTSQACKVTSTLVTKEFLLARTDETGMNPEWFIWDGSSYNDMPNQNW